MLFHGISHDELSAELSKTATKQEQTEEQAETTNGPPPMTTPRDAHGAPHERPREETTAWTHPLPFHLTPSELSEIADITQDVTLDGGLAEVADALKRFVDDFRRLKGLDEQPDDPELSSDCRSTGFWQQLVATHPGEHDQVWNALSESLESYAEILKDRATALDEADALRAQNGKLKMLLHQYMSADINRELHIPPRW